MNRFLCTSLAFYFLVMGCNKRSQSIPTKGSAATSKVTTTLTNDYTWIDPSSGAKAIIAVYVSRDTADSPSLIAAIFNDGAVVSSRDSIHGGPPYNRGGISRKTLDDIIAALRQQIAKVPNKRIYYGWDATYTTISISLTGEHLVLKSWHDLYESNHAGVLATQNGLVALEGRSKETVQSEWSSEYSRFRESWRALRAIATPSEFKGAALDYSYTPRFEKVDQQPQH